MKEVSCRALDVFVRALRAKRIDPALLAQGTGYDLAHLCNKHERVEWETWERIVANVRPHVDDRELEVMGAAFLSSPLLRSISVFARLLFSPRDFYNWVNAEGRPGCPRLEPSVKVSLDLNTTT